MDRHSRRCFLQGVLSVAALALLPGCKLAPPRPQPTPAVRRIGYLTGGFVNDPGVEAFRQGLRDLGYVEGESAAIEYREAAGPREHLPTLAAELAGLGVELVVTPGEDGAEATRRAAPALPVVMMGASDPVGRGLAASLARPGGSVTGLQTVFPEIYGKRLELLRQVVPASSTVAALWNGANPGLVSSLEEIRRAAGTLGLRVQVLDVRRPDDLEGAFAAAVGGRAEALLAFGDPMLIRNQRRVVDLAARSRLPAMYATRSVAEIGGLLAYGPDIREASRHAATYVDKILRGARPADLPIERPTAFDFVVNLATAATLGLSIPEAVLQQATELIQ